MSQLDKAIMFAIRAHAGQLDKGGQPYILHPLRVMMRLGFDASEEDRITAVLHDVVEDCGVTLSSIAKEFGLGVSEPVRALSRFPGESYNDYMGRVKKNPRALRVKKADLEDNTDEDRTPLPDQAEHVQSLRKRYQKILLELKQTYFS